MSTQKKHTINSDQTARAICTVIRHMYHYTDCPRVKKLCTRAFELGKEINNELILNAAGYAGYAKYWDVDDMPESVIKIAQERHPYRPKEFTAAIWEDIHTRRDFLTGHPIFDILRKIIEINTSADIDLYAHEALWMAERMINKLKEANGE